MNNKFVLTSEEERIMDIISNAIIDLLLSNCGKQLLIRGVEKDNLNKKVTDDIKKKNGNTLRN